MTVFDWLVKAFPALVNIVDVMNAAKVKAPDLAPEIDAQLALLNEPLSIEALGRLAPELLTQGFAFFRQGITDPKFHPHNVV